MSGAIDRGITLTAYELASRFVGLKEVGGTVSEPQILAMLRLDQRWPEGDEVPWCSAFVNYVCWLLRLPRSKNLRARSWLCLGWPVPIGCADVGFDVVVLTRGGGFEQPGPDVIDAPGHVGFYGGLDGDTVAVLGGNQSNAVNLSRYPVNRILGIRRIH